jgi:hypothetical protein
MTTAYPLFAAPPALDAPPIQPPAPTSTPTAPVDLEAQTIILSLTLRAPGATKKVTGVTVRKRQAELNTEADEADPDALRVSKEILDCPEWDAVTSEQTALRAWIKARAVPSKLLKAGLYRVPVMLVEEADNHLIEGQKKVDEALSVFLWRYPDLIQERRKVLKELWDPTDYPAAEAIKRAVSVEWAYIAVGTPDGQLASISAAMAAREKAKAAQAIQGEAQAIMEALRQEALKMCSHLVERLTPGPDGKAKTFRDSLTANLTEWLDLVAARNVTGDTILADAAAKARAALQGVDPQDLRDSTRLRQHVAQQFAGIQEALSAAVVNKPARSITLEGEV